MRIWPALLLLGLFLGTRALARGWLGLSFDAAAFESWQVLDPGLLERDLLRSLLYLHSQPPLFNLFLGLGLKLAPGRAAACFDLAFLAISFLGLLGSFALVRELGASRRVALVAAALQALSATWIVYESWLFYTLPTAVLLTWCCVWLARAARGVRGAAWWFSLLVTAVAFLRSTYHLLWVVAAVGLLMVASRREPQARRAAWRASSACLLTVVALYAKNGLIVGSFASSSWLGMSLAMQTTDRLEPQTREAWIRRGTLDPVAAIPAFSPLGDYPPAWRAIPAGTPQHPALTAPTKAGGGPNFNHVAYVQIAHASLRTAWGVTRRRPDLLASSVRTAVLAWLKPPNDYDFVWRLRDRLGAWDRLHSRWILWSSSTPAGPGPCRALFVLAALTLAVPLVRRSGERRHTLLLLALPILTIGLNLCVGSLVETEENNRFRVEVEPLIWALGIWAASDLAGRWREWGFRRSGGLLPAEPQLSHQVDDDHQVADQQHRARDREPVRDLVDLDGDVEPAGGRTQPLGPAPGVPQAVGLGQTDGGVGRRQGGEGPQPGVGRPAGGVDEDPWETAGRVEVEVRDDLLGQQLQVVVQQSQGAAAGGEHQRTLRSLEQRDRPQASLRFHGRIRTTVRPV